MGNSRDNIKAQGDLHMGPKADHFCFKQLEKNTFMDPSEDSKQGLASGNVFLFCIRIYQTVASRRWTMEGNIQCHTKEGKPIQAGLSVIYCQNQIFPCLQKIRKIIRGFGLFHCGSTTLFCACPSIASLPCLGRSGRRGILRAPFPQKVASNRIQVVVHLLCCGPCHLEHYSFRRSSHQLSGSQEQHIR